MAYFLHLNFHIRKRNLWNQHIVQIKIYLCKKIHEIKILPFEAISNKKGVIRFLEEHFGSSPSILSLAEFFLLVGDFEFFCKSFNKFFGGISSIVTLNDESSSESWQRKKIGEIKIHTLVSWIIGLFIIRVLCGTILENINILEIIDCNKSPGSICLGNIINVLDIINVLYI